ncbi:3-hydroxyacyl-CoA dehydrogenase [Herbiconiux sp. CPCC 205763]|uniref:3-hydroxyacyl-CoA dehydrogenase n=1 Tax=Herbiconiux aconitum TaxID=2970913 RepID=A0ABT2GXV2_9MICO|nr:3-hydroxyacyl-CoA dehydrogenase [Herbiconiux aconitum]MCS5720135.1 3-hydroxyacyl-CoA dehydrogenase [Herbiconiux aconitum]
MSEAEAPRASAGLAARAGAAASSAGADAARSGADATRSVVAIAGAGSIGVAFAVLFASAGHPVRVWDAFPEAFERARADLRSRLGLLSEFGLLAESPDEVAARVSFDAELADAVAGAGLVQECAPERVELKRDLFAAIAAVTPADAILASSSSAITPSTILAGMDVAGLAARLIVAHPGNPPYLLSVIELVPSPATDAAVLERASALYRGAGLRPVLVRKEVEGFIFNRLQGAVLREAYALVRDGVATVDDIDEVVRSGLGRRWSFIGPFETVDLNTRGGLASHAEKMGPAYERMGAERGQHDPWTADLVATAVAQRRALLPLEEWEARVRWRDEQLMRLKPLWDEMRR